MADEIKVFVRLQLDNNTNNFTRYFNPPQLGITQNSAGAFENTVALTTTDTKLTISNITVPGVGYFQNISASSTCVILVGADSTNVIRPFTRIKQREAWPIRLTSGTTYRAQMEASTGMLLFGVWED
jgi:hypothetical protein